MGLRAESRDELRKESVTEIHGQPTDHDITTLKRNSMQSQQASRPDSEEETMAMQESLSKPQSTLPWQESHLQTQSTPESIQQVLQQQRQPEKEPEQKPNTKKI